MGRALSVYVGVALQATGVVLLLLWIGTIGFIVARGGGEMGLALVLLTLLVAIVAMANE